MPAAIIKPIEMDSAIGIEKKSSSSKISFAEYDESKYCCLIFSIGPPSIILSACSGLRAI